MENKAEHIRQMSDESLLRLSRILKLTRAVHEYGQEDRLVAAEVERREYARAMRHACQELSK